MRRELAKTRSALFWLTAATVLLFFYAGGQPANADGLDWSQLQLNASGPTAQGGGAISATPDANAVSNFISAWQATAAQARANQPAWSTPLVTSTGILEQRFRFDFANQQAGNGSGTTVLDGGKGLDLIVSNSNEIQIALPPYDLRLGIHAGETTGAWEYLPTLHS